MWDANHVWLVFVFVILWTGFPEAYASITYAKSTSERKPAAVERLTAALEPADEPPCRTST